MKTVLIANRGEIACRIITSCKRLGLLTVAVFSDADRDAVHVEMADHACHIGGAKPVDSYLKGDDLIQIARRTGADLVHPGYGFLAESAHFAQKVINAGLVWVGPAPQAIADMGDKERAREIAEAAGVPVVPGSRRFAEGNLDGLAKAAKRVGYPLLVKAVAGGGGIGMRLVETPGNLDSVVRATQDMATRFFGDGTVFLERYIRRARHIEVQVFGFGDGRVVHLFERECSVQRRFQKIIEEAPAPNFPERLRAAIVKAAVALASNQSYSGAGTIEFIYDQENGEFYFLEMNTRIQVEHPVTEMVTRTDLVGLQLKLVMGCDLSTVTQDNIHQNGHAIECRVYAENPDMMFLPSPGRVERLVFPDQAESVRIESGVRQGDEITAYYDPMIAKVITYGAHRKEALSRMQTTLGEIELAGLKNNLEFLSQCVRHPAFVSAQFDTGFVDRYKAELC